ncbi:MAG: hypothetical protein IJI25_09075 [Eubacterium sp.]|nr:hypothetical protein [Eubacterium sp.]
MSAIQQEIERYEKKIKNCQTMTELLTAMSSWQSFAERKGLTAEQKNPVDQAYIETEARLIPHVKSSLW